MDKGKNNKHEGLVESIKINFDRAVIFKKTNPFINRMNKLFIVNGQPGDVELFDWIIPQKFYMVNTVFLENK